jgi:hypothetical protein
MVRDVFVEICETQQQFEHALPLLRVWIGCLFLEVLDNGQRIREQPFEIFSVHGMALAAMSESVVGADKCLIEKMIEAQVLRRESGRDHIGAWGPSAISWHGGLHSAPQTLGRNIPEVRGRETTIIFSQGWKYQQDAVTKTHMPRPLPAAPGIARIGAAPVIV